MLDGNVELLYMTVHVHVRLYSKVGPTNFPWQLRHTTTLATLPIHKSATSTCKSQTGTEQRAKENFGLVLARMD